MSIVACYLGENEIILGSDQLATQRKMKAKYLESKWLKFDTSLFNSPIKRMTYVGITGDIVGFELAKEWYRLSQNKPDEYRFGHIQGLDDIYSFKALTQDRHPHLALIYYIIQVRKCPEMKKKLVYSAYNLMINHHDSDYELSELSPGFNCTGVPEACLGAWYAIEELGDADNFDKMEVAIKSTVKVSIMCDGLYVDRV